MANVDVPRARTSDLETIRFDDETVVYDRQTDKAHCLNQTAALVWENCDGKTEASDIARTVATTLGAPAPQEVIALAIADLKRAGLLEPVVGARAGARGLSRREVIRKTAGMTMIALPLVSTIVAPTSAGAATVDCSCVVPGDCIVKTSCPSTVNCNGSGLCAP